MGGKKENSSIADTEQIQDTTQITPEIRGTIKQNENLCVDTCVYCTF